MIFPGIRMKKYFYFLFILIIPVIFFIHPSNHCRVAILYLSTGRYIAFWDQFYQATEKYFLPGTPKTYFLFTDHTDLKLPDNVVSIYTPQQPWPYITLKRYHFFWEHRDELKQYDYLFFINGNLIFQQPISDEVLPTKEQGLMVTLHPGYFKDKRADLPYDKNQASRAFVAPDEGKYYFMGGFNGGTSTAFLNMAQTIKTWIDIDLKNKVMPAWHDESMLNRYMIDYMKDKNPLILPPNYAVPEGKEKDHQVIKGLLLNKGTLGGHKWFRQVK